MTDLLSRDDIQEIETFLGFICPNPPKAVLNKPPMASLDALHQMHTKYARGEIGASDINRITVLEHLQVLSDAGVRQATKLISVLDPVEFLERPNVEGGAAPGTLVS